MAATPCVARSAERTAALIELYTGDRCSGCPPAERWLSALGGRFAAQEVVPVSLHVDYWAYLGAKARHVQPRLAGREGKLLLRQRMALVYAPQVLLQGQDFGDWSSAAFERAVARINASPAAARLSLEIRAATPSGLSAAIEAEVLDARRRDDAALYLAVVQARAPGDYVVLEWQGPLAARSDGRFAEARRLDLLPAATPRSSGVAAFVQDRRSGEVLQALLLIACSP